MSFNSRSPASTRQSLPIDKKDSNYAASSSACGEGASIFHDAPETRPSKRRHLVTLGIEIKSKPKEILNKVKHVSAHESFANRSTDENEQDISSNPAFNPALDFENRKVNGLQGKLRGSVESIGRATKAAFQPQRTMISSAAKRMTASNNAYLTQEADEKLKQARDDLDKASSIKNGLDDEALIGARSAVERIENQRDDMRAAWITRGHVQRVRIVPKRHISYPERALYKIHDLNGKYERIDWLRWIGHILLYLSRDFSAQYIDETDQVPFSRTALAQNAERLLIATAPWQMWFMRLRKVYRWDDPWLTGRWLVLYLILLKTGYFMTFFYSYVVYIVLMNRIYPQSANELRDHYERAVQGNTQVQQLGELIERHGGDKWLDPLIEELGPLAQQQLADTADFLEVLTNFYHWQYKWATINTLILWTTAAIVSALTSLEYGNKILWFVLGLFFFVSRPIATRYPKYRRIVSVFRVIYWDIPTFAEQAFRRLRYEAHEIRKEIASRTIDNNVPMEINLEDSTNQLGTFPIITRNRSSSTSSLSSLASAKSYVSQSSVSSDLASQYTPVTRKDTTNTVLTICCRWQRQPGNLIFTTSGILFERRLLFEHKPVWTHSYVELIEIKKLQTASSVLPGSTTRIGRKLQSKVTSSTGLGLVWTDGSEDVLERLENRDEAFNCALGFSGSRWMVVSPPEELSSATN